MLGNLGIRPQRIQVGVRQVDRGRVDVDVRDTVGSDVQGSDLKPTAPRTNADSSKPRITRILRMKKQNAIVIDLIGPPAHDPFV